MSLDPTKGLEALINGASKLGLPTPEKFIKDLVVMQHDLDELKKDHAKLKKQVAKLKKLIASLQVDDEDDDE